MKALTVHTCPVWEDDDGSRRPGFTPEDDHPPVVGWCNVLVAEIAGEQHAFLLVYEDRDDSDTDAE